MKKVGVVCVAVVVGVWLGGRARAQTVEVVPPAEPPTGTPPPEATPTPPPEAPPSPPPSAPPAPAAAPTFGAAWQFAISIERAFGFDYISQTRSTTTGYEYPKTTATTFSLLGAPLSGPVSGFSFPRAAFDLFVARDLSVGIGLGVIYGSSNMPNGQSFTGLLAAPRVGYALRLSPDITFWPRAGVSVLYLTSSDDLASRGYGTIEMPTHAVAATVELPFVFTLASHVAVTFGPTLDVTFDGSITSGFVEGAAPTYNERLFELGVQAGLLVNL